MARGGRKYRLLIYPVMLNRWWPVPLTLAIIFGLYLGILWAAELFWQGNPLPRPTDTLNIGIGGLAGFCFLFTLFFLAVRNAAYVQLFPGYLRVSTPFFRFNLSYKRIVRTSTSEVSAIFPMKSISSWRAEIIEPLAFRTANILHLKGYPIPRFWLSMFLSPFFFMDKTDHLVLILDDWMRFNAEYDSMRLGGGKTPVHKPAAQTQANPSGLLADLNRDYRAKEKERKGR